MTRAIHDAGWSARNIDIPGERLVFVRNRGQTPGQSGAGARLAATAATAVPDAADAGR
ncbi:hypothetical protein FF36_05636 [Frankia torreyi]|uniref:Uncharacterized protein n=1 Tax=Frankia torreyi TaxID=1856 RepID=A0A0D8B9M8_9ACTN|nr:hypothetical protein FF36_05636 [Frankia torreyi]